MRWILIIFGLSLSVEAYADAASEKRFEECRSKLIQAQKLEVLYDMDWKSPKEPKVVAGPTFFQMPIDAKEGFTETVNCFTLGLPDDKRKVFVSWPDSKEIDGIFYKPRAGGAAMGEHWRYKDYPGLVVSIMDGAVYEIASNTDGKTRVRGRK